MLIEVASPDNEIFRSYKGGIIALLPEGLFEDESDRQTRLALERAAKGVIRRTVGNYITNHSRVVESQCAEFSPTMIQTAPNPHQYYGNIRQITGSSANIADSSHYYLMQTYKNYIDLQQKLRTFDGMLHQDRFYLNITLWLLTGFSGSYLTASLRNNWQVTLDWIRQFSTGMAK